MTEQQKQAALAALVEFFGWVSDGATLKIEAEKIPGWVIVSHVGEGEPFLDCYRWSDLLRWYKRAVRRIADQLRAGDKLNLGAAMESSLANEEE